MRVIDGRCAAPTGIAIAHIFKAIGPSIAQVIAMTLRFHWGTRAYWVVTALLLTTAIGLVTAAPIDSDMGLIQKLIYLHLPVAINTFLGSFVVFVASVAFLGARRQLWDDLAYAAACVCVLNGTILMLTGVIWAQVYWGVWWVWSPRLIFSLILWLLYVGYLILRPIFGATYLGAIVASIYGIVAFLDVPLVYLTIKLLPDVHPTHIEMTAEMNRILVVWFVAITMLTGGLIASRFSVARLQSAIHRVARRPA